MLPQKRAQSHPQPKHPESMPQWTQEEAVAYECAREAIGGMIAICSALIHAEEEKETPDLARIAALDKKQTEFENERKHLRLKQHEKIAYIRREYGGKLRAYLKEDGSCPV